jgi:hypothetical protein
MICEYCDKEFTNMSYFNKHKKTAKYCLKIQKELGIDNILVSEIKTIIKCNLCLKIFSNKPNLI